MYYVGMYDLEQLIIDGGRGKAISATGANAGRDTLIFLGTPTRARKASWIRNE